MSSPDNGLQPGSLPCLHYNDERRDRISTNCPEKFSPPGRRSRNSETSPELLRFPQQAGGDGLELSYLARSCGTHIASDQCFAVLANVFVSSRILPLRGKEFP